MVVVVVGGIVRGRECVRLPPPYIVVVAVGGVGVLVVVVVGSMVVILVGATVVETVIEF